MGGGWATLRFLKGSTLGGVREARLSETTLVQGGSKLPADVYEPAGRVRGTVLFVHGMTVLGHRDPRQVRACHVLAGAGLRVVAPRVPGLAALHVRLEDLEHVADAVLAVSARPELGGGRPVGVFSVSYSAGLCLIAAAREAVQPHVAALLALGTYSDGVGWARWLVEAEEADEYGRLLMLRQFLPEVLGPRPGVDEALLALLTDLVMHDGEPRFQAVMARIEDEERRLVERLRGDRAWCSELSAVLRAKGTYERFRPLCPADVAPRLRVPVALVHGATDRVVPPQESRDLHALLDAGGAPTRLVVTGLLTHGDVALGPHVIGEAIDVFRTFAHFFGAVERARGAVG